MEEKIPLKYNICPNCGKLITCGCQIKKSLNGKDCCSKCVRSLDMLYIKQMKKEKAKKKRKFL